MRSKKTCRWELRKSLGHKTLCGKIRQVNGNSFVIFGLYLVCFCFGPCLILKGQGAMLFFFHSSVAGTCLPLLHMFFCAFLFTVQIVGPFRCFNWHMHGSSGRTILLPLPVQSKSFRIWNLTLLMCLFGLQLRLFPFFCGLGPSPHVLSSLPSGSGNTNKIKKIYSCMGNAHEQCVLATRMSNAQYRATEQRFRT